MPEFLGTTANLLGIFLVWMLISKRASDEYHFSARRCFQWMIMYLLMHAAIHASWGYRFRSPFSAVMNIAYIWMRHHGFTVSWLHASPEKQNTGRRLSEGCVAKFLEVQRRAHNLLKSTEMTSFELVVLVHFSKMCSPRAAGKRTSQNVGNPAKPGSDC